MKMGVKGNILLLFSLLVCLVILTSGCEELNDEEPLFAPISCKTYEGTPAQCTYAPIGEEDYDSFCPDGFFHNTAKSCYIKKDRQVASEIQQPLLSPGGDSVKICCWPYACNDGKDNDGDGLIDGDDDGCIRNATHAVADPIEEIDCQDGFDDDGDGLVDEDDPGCYLWSSWENKLIYTPFSNYERSGRYKCDNGIDDDGDGLKDYREDGLGDPECQSPFDNNEEDDPDCVDPEEITPGDQIENSMTFCKNEIFDWHGTAEDWGIDLRFNGGTLDCNGAKIIGNGYFDNEQLRQDTGAIKAAGRNGLTIKNCNIEGFNTGLDVVASYNLIIENNEFKNNAFGVYLDRDSPSGSRIADIFNNDFIGNSQVGLSVFKSNNVDRNQIYQNNFIDNVLAIKLEGYTVDTKTTNNDVYDNYIMGNDQGIELILTNGNNIERNNFVGFGGQTSFVCDGTSSDSGTNFCEAGTACGGLNCVFSEAEDDNTLLLLHFDGDLIGAQEETPTAESSVTNYPTYEYGQGAEITTGNYLAYLNDENIIKEKGTIEFIVVPYWDGSTLVAGFPFIEAKEDRDEYPKGYGVGTFYGNGPGEPHPNKFYLFFNVRQDHGEWSFFEAQTFFGEDTVVETWEANSVHHIKVTWDFVDDKHLRLFVDGEIVDEVTEQNCFSCDWSNFPPDTIGDFITVGTNLDGDKVVNGIIDELRISDIPR